MAHGLASVLGPNKQTFTLDTESGEEKYALRVSEVPRVDAEWRTILGDCLFNLRSALDHLANQLVILGSKTPTSATIFHVK